MPLSVQFVRFLFGFIRRGLLLSTLFILSYLSLVSEVYAEKKVELYSADKLVLDQSEAIRQQAAMSALSDILVRVSGNPSVLDHPSIKTAILQANSYLSQYSYETTDQTITLAGDTRPARRLLMQFSSLSIQRLFKSAKLPIWPANRPEVLLWVAGEKRGRRILDTGTSEVSSFKAAASSRGLPLTIPLLDLSDRQTLSVVRLWALDESSIANASSRYGVDGVLAGRIFKHSDAASVWRASFVFLEQGERRYFTASSTSQQQLIQEIIDQTANYLASVNTIIENEDGTAPIMSVSVSNVSTFESYADVLSFFKALPLVADAAVRRVDGQSMTLDLAYNGRLERLLSTLNSATELEREVAVSSSHTPPSTDIAPTVIDDNGDIIINEPGVSSDPATIELPSIPVAYRWR